MANVQFLVPIKTPRGKLSLNSPLNWVFLVFISLLVVFIFAATNQARNIDQVPVILIVTFIGLLCFHRLSINDEQKRILLAGFEGEKKALKILKQLPSEYYILNHLQIPSRGDYTTEIDFVVIGPNRIFIVEIKNYSGILKGTAEDLQWKHIKKDKNGKQISKKIENPILQVNRQVSVIERILSSTGIVATVSGIVLFVNKRSKLQIKGPSPVQLFYNDKLLTFITDAPAGDELDDPGLIAEVVRISGNQPIREHCP